MKFQPGIPHLFQNRKGLWCWQSFNHCITFYRTHHTYSTFRYYAGCRWFEALKSAA